MDRERIGSMMAGSGLGSGRRIDRMGLGAIRSKERLLRVCGGLE